MDALPNDESLRMDDFSVQPMPMSTPMPWENFGIMMNPFQNPMQMMRQVYPLPSQLQQQEVAQQEQQHAVQRVQEQLLAEQQHSLLAAQLEQQQHEQQLQMELLAQRQQQQQQLLLSQQEQRPVLLPPQLLVPQQQQQQQLQVMERKPTLDGSPKVATPQGPEAIRNKLRQALMDALKMVATEQPKEEVTAFLESPKAEEVVAVRPGADVDVCDSLDHHEFQFPPPVIIRKPRSKLLVPGGKGNPAKKLRSDGVEVSWEVKVANHAKLLSRNIELELFRMFRDVNKKYREKARSLKFNLADKNNPELRARVFVGEIGAQALCNMTIEQLASKELSQWRMAKAEERAQMVVITDDDVNTSKLVKKTHKGEFVMEVDSDTAPDVLVHVGSSMKEKSEASEEADVSKEQQQVDESGSLDEQESAVVEEDTMMAEAPPAAPSEAAPVADGAEETDGSKILEENTDVLLDVSDFKGLPEIMSMDGYLKSVGSAHKEDGTPFEEKVVMNEETSVQNLQSSKVPPREKSPEEESRTDTSTTTSVVQQAEGNNPLKRKQPEDCSPSRERSSSPRSASEKRRHSPSTTTTTTITTTADDDRRGGEKLSESSRIAELWDGSLQLTGTRSTAVRAVFRSGHEVKLDAWPKSLGVKGRVKVGHLGKFLKELGSSKSRTVTGLSFYSSDMATSSLSLLKEVVDGYEKGERVGYAEPADGFELYLLPPGESAWKFLSENGRLKPDDESGIPKDRSEVLVGCVVWRKSTSTSASQSGKTRKSHSSSGSSSSKSKTGQTSSASRSKHTPSIPSALPASTSALPPAVTVPPPPPVTTTFGFPSSSAAPLSTLLQQTSQSVVVKHPVNEWQQSSLCPMPPVGVDSVVAAPVPGPPGPPLPPPFSLGGMFFPPGFSAPANNNSMSNIQQQLLPGGMLPGLEVGGPPGFHQQQQQCSVTSLDDLPEYDDLVASSPLKYGMSSTYNNGHQFHTRAFQQNQVTCAPAETYGPPAQQQQQDVHSFGVHHEWRPGHALPVSSAQAQQQQQQQHVQHHVQSVQVPSHHHQQQQQQTQPQQQQQQHMFIPTSQPQVQQVQHGPPPLPPGPPPLPSFGQWMHPNQAAHQHHKPSPLHYKRSSHSNGSRRYRN